MENSMLSVWTSKALAGLRIVSSLLFIEHGTQKLFGFPTPIHGMPPILSLQGIGGCLELVGGLLLLVGVKTRPVALILSGEMAVAYWMFIAPKSFFPAVNGGDAAVLFCFLFLFFVFSGAGAWSWDERSSSSRLPDNAAVSG
jgi:putative oxidoreductase